MYKYMRSGRLKRQYWRPKWKALYRIPLRVDNFQGAKEYLCVQRVCELVTSVRFHSALQVKLSVRAAEGKEKNNEKTALICIYI